MGMPTLEELDELFQERMFKALRSLADVAGRISEEKGWRTPTPKFGEELPRAASPVELQALIASEAFEAMEWYRLSHNPAQFFTEVDGKPQGVASEIADVIIRALDYCQKYGVDIGPIIAQKLAYNMGRSYQHGGKVV